MKRRTMGSLLALLGAAMGIAAAPALAQMQGWEKDLYEAAKKEKEFTVYSAHYNTEEMAKLCAAFDQKYTGVKCNFVRTTAQVAFQRFQQDLQANKPVASVFSSTDVGHYVDLKKRGELMPYRPNNLSKMVDSLKQYNDADGNFTVTAAALMLITYNSSLVTEKDAPKNWPDLLDPKWKGKVSIGHPAFSGYVGTWVVLMRKLYGWDYFEKLEKNEPQIGRSVNDTVTMLNAKERWHPEERAVAQRGQAVHRVPARQGGGRDPGQEPLAVGHQGHQAGAWSQAARGHQGGAPDRGGDRQGHPRGQGEVPRHLRRLSASSS
jgi:iron(III) transport system substrate-binding protein